MLLALTLASGAILGWQAATDGFLPTVPLAVAVAAGLTLAGYVRFLAKDWRGVVGRLLQRGGRAVQREAMGTFVWSFLLRLLVMGTAGVLGYWAAGLYR